MEVNDIEVNGTTVNGTTVDGTTVNGMTVTVNGVSIDLTEVTSVAALVAAHSDERRCVAVALNGDVVPRSQWDVTRLGAGDRLEVLAPTAGG